MSEQPSTPPSVPASPDPPSISPPGQPWGFWGTVGLSLVIVLVYVVVQVAVALVYLAVTNSFAAVGQLAEDGLFFAISVIACAPVMVGACMLAARLRKGIRVADYLGLHRPTGRHLRHWCLGLLALGALSDLVSTLFGKPWVPEVMIDLYQNAKVLWLLWIALIVAAPLGEETFFRGFLLPGLQRSVLGRPGAVLLSAAAWAGIHQQYDLYAIGILFVIGIFLGYARLKTGSLWLCMVLHALLNLVSTIQLELYLAVTKP